MADMADMERRIGQWRHELAESLGGSAEWLAELEGHLRDEVQHLEQAGQPSEQAFATAVARVGGGPALADEFARVTSATPWLPVRLAVFASIAIAGWLVGMLFTSGRLRESGLLLASHVSTITLGYCLTLLIGTLAACYTLARPFGGPDARQLQGLVRSTLRMTVAALALTALGVALGGFWAEEHWGRFWGWDPKEVGGAAVILWDVVALALLGARFLGAHATLLLGLAGNAVVALAWFGPIILRAGPNAYGSPTQAAPLALFLLTQAALACLGFVPAGSFGRRRGDRALGGH